MFEKLYKIKDSETDANKRILPHALLKYMEDVAIKNADENGIGYASLKEFNYGWFLLKYAIEFEEYPTNIETIILSTQSKGGNKHFTYRDFGIYTNNHTKIGKATTTWALMDLKNKTILNPLEILSGKINEYNKAEDIMSYQKILMPNEFEHIKTFEVSNSEIDLNGHVNNTIYTRWAYETLPQEIINKTIKRIDINYKKEVTVGNTIVSKANYAEGKTAHTIINQKTGEDLCTIMIKWLD